MHQLKVLILKLRAIDAASPSAIVIGKVLQMPCSAIICKLSSQLDSLCCTGVTALKGMRRDDEPG